MGAVANYATLDDDATLAVLDGDAAVLLGDDACGILVRGLDGTSNVQVLDGGVLHILEGRSIFSAGGVVEGQRLLVAVENAGEVVVAGARHVADGDVAVSPSCR